ncbi:DUF7112 family protein [Haloferacaceae archaeon DSL9]
MSERIASDNAGIDTHRATVARLGGTRRRCVRIPDAVAADLSEGDLVRIVFDRTEHHARVAGDADGLLLRGAYENRRLARTRGDGDNRLAAWLAASGREPGQSVELDVVLGGDLYGLRTPGERAVYQVKEGPKDSLASIAERLDGDR